jgi:predicted nucleic acid-binding protein
MGLIYLDSCLVIYLVERHPRFSDVLRRLLVRHGAETFAVSPLVRLECLVGPRKRHDAAAESDYAAALDQLRTVPLTEQVYDDATTLRATRGLRTPDALHLAAARVARCAALWTNDRRFHQAAPGFACSLEDLAADLG